MNTRKGFTLVELLVVIAILAILATVSVVGYTSFIARAEKSNAETEAHQVQSAINSYIVTGEDFVIGTNSSKNVYVDADTKKVMVDDTTDVEAKSLEITKGTDFAGLPGALYVDANGKLLYVYDKGTDNTVGTTDDSYVEIVIK